MPLTSKTSWITAHAHAYQFYDGVTRSLTPDNLKTGVIRNTKSEAVINRVYQEMAEHYGTAIVPARPGTPKDMALVEDPVGVVSTWILAALRNHNCGSPLPGSIKSGAAKLLAEDLSYIALGITHIVGIISVARSARNKK